MANENQNLDFEAAGGPANDSIYTASGTVPTSVVATLTDTLTFDLGTTATLLQRGIKLDADSIYYTSGSSLPIFEATNNNGQIFNLTASGFLQTYSDLGGTIARLYARGGTQGLALGSNGTTLAVEIFKIQNTFAGGNDYVTFEVDPTFSQMYMATGGTFEHWLRTGTSAQATFFRNGINGSGFNVGGSGAIGSEKISLQGRTLVKGADTLSTSTAFEIYDGDTTPAKLWDFRNNGDVYQGKDSTQYLQGNDFTISTLSGSTTPINYEFGTAFGGYYSRWDNNGALTIKSGTTNIAFRVLSKVDATATMFRVGNEGGGFMSTNNGRLWTISDSTTSTTKNEFDENRFSQYWAGGEYHRIQTSGSGSGVSFFRFGISGGLGYFIVGGSSRIGSEEISLQGNTLVKGSTTTSAVKGFEVVDSANASKFEVRNNGDIYTNGTQGLSATYTFGGGSTGDIASMTFTNGILTAVTTVP